MAGIPITFLNQAARLLWEEAIICDRAVQKMSQVDIPSYAFGTVPALVELHRTWQDYLANRLTEIIDVRDALAWQASALIQVARDFDFTDAANAYDIWETLDPDDSSHESTLDMLGPDAQLPSHQGQYPDTGRYEVPPDPGFTRPSLATPPPLEGTNPEIKPPGHAKYSYTTTTVVVPVVEEVSPGTLDIAPISVVEFKNVEISVRDFSVSTETEDGERDALDQVLADHGTELEKTKFLDQYYGHPSPHRDIFDDVIVPIWLTSPSIIHAGVDELLPIFYYLEELSTGGEGRYMAMVGALQAEWGYADAENNTAVRSTWTSHVDQLNAYISKVAARLRSQILFGWGMVEAVKKIRQASADVISEHDLVDGEAENMVASIAKALVDIIDTNYKDVIKSLLTGIINSITEGIEKQKELDASITKLVALADNIGSLGANHEADYSLDMTDTFADRKHHDSPLTHDAY